MDFDFNEEQKAIVNAAERVFSDLCSDDRIKEINGENQPFHAELWQQLAESGMLGLLVSEENGGLGMTLVELCLILELQGRFVAPVPLIATLVECGMSIDASDNESLKGELLPAIVSGELMLSPVRRSGGFVASVPLTATEDASGDWSLNGVSGLVPYAGIVNGFVVSVPTKDEEPVMMYCRADAKGLSINEQRSTSGELAGFIEFDNTAVPNAQVLATGDSARAIAETQKLNTCIALAALQVGVLDEGLRRTAAYVSERKQFGRPLGAFQAVSQQAADAYMAIEALRSVYWRALDDIEHEQGAALSARVAKYWVGTAGHKVAHTILHLHGGIGQDLDYPVHRFFLWGKHNERYLGTPGMLALDTGTLITANAEAIISAGTAR